VEMAPFAAIGVTTPYKTEHHTMAASSVVTMSRPDRWLAFLRIVVGLYFVKSLVTKMSIVLLGGVLPVPAVSERWINVMPNIVAKQASQNPIAFYNGAHAPRAVRAAHGLGGDRGGPRAHAGAADGAILVDRPGDGHELRARHSVDVSRPAGLPSGAVRADDRLLRGPRGTPVGSGRAHCGVQAGLSPRT
jgi:hypothetical protein